MRKKLFKATNIVAWLAATFLILTISACGNIAGDGVSGDVKSGNRTLTGYIDGYTKTGARSVIPTMPDGDTLKYYLYGTSANGLKTKDATGVEGWMLVDPDDDGVFEIDLGAQYWNLTLVATKNVLAATDIVTTSLDAIKNIATLIGYCSVDLSRASAKATFVLTTNGLTTPGTLKVSLKLDGWDLPDGVESNCYLRDTVTGEVIKDTSNVAIQAENNSLNKTTAVDFPGATAATVNAGTYNLVVEFTDGTDTDYWPESVLIIPGTETTGEILIPNIYGNPPTGAITDFYAFYNDKTEESVIPGKYDVEFTWDPSTVKGESEFELEIADITSLTTKTLDDANTDARWDANITVDTKVYNSSSITDMSAGVAGTKIPVMGGYPAGSLFANSETVTVRLDLEKKYVARIRGVNRSGSTDWVYVALNGTAPTDCEKFDATTKKVITLFKVTYDLRGGIYTPSAGVTDPDAVVYGKIVKYGSASITHFADDPENTIKKGGQAWKQWNNVVGRTKYDTTAAGNNPYSGPNNLELYAVYASHSYDIPNPNDYMIKSEWVTVGTQTLSAGDKKVDLSRGAGDVTTADNGTLVWKITLPAGLTKIAGNNAVYDSITIRMGDYYSDTQTDIETDETNATEVEFTQTNVDDLPPAYPAVIIAVIGGSYRLELPIMVNIGE